MEKKYSSYETLFVVDLSLGAEAVSGLVSRFVGMISENGILTGVNEWGKRRLAYPINDMNEGYYVVVTFNAPQAFPAELDRVFGITEGIMRSMTIVTEPVEATEAFTFVPKAIAVPAEETAEAAAEEAVADEAPAAEEAPAEAAAEAPAAEEAPATEAE